MVASESEVALNIFLYGVRLWNVYGAVDLADFVSRVFAIRHRRSLIDDQP